MNLDLIIPEPTNAERDANTMGYTRRDVDSRWDKYPDVRVTLSSGVDLDEHATWGYLATQDDGSFVTGSNYRSAESARRQCVRAIERGVWQKPTIKYRQARRSEVFGKICEPTGQLKDFLVHWDEKFA